MMIAKRIRMIVGVYVSYRFSQILTFISVESHQVLLYVMEFIFIPSSYHNAHCLSGQVSPWSLFHGPLQSQIQLLLIIHMIGHLD